MKIHKKKFTYTLSAWFLAASILVLVPFYAFAASDYGTLIGLTANDAGLAAEWTASNDIAEMLGGTVNGSCAKVVGAAAIDITAAAHDGRFSDYATTVTVTLKNNNDDKKEMTLEFTISGSAVSSVTPSSGAATVSDSSPYMYTLPYGESVAIAYTNSSTTSATRNITNIKFYSNEDTTITFQPAPVNPDGNETCSYSLVLADGTTKEITETYPIGYQQVAKVVPISTDSNYEFVGWRTSTGTFLDYDSTLSTLTYLFTKPNDPITVEPVFVPKTSGMYQVSDNFYFYWEDAMAAAVAQNPTSSNPITVTLKKAGTLLNTASYNKSGTYVSVDTNGNFIYQIPQYVNFLVPYSSTDTGQFDGTAEPSTIQSTVQKGAYMTLTVSGGAKINCNGNVNVNAVMKVAGPSDTGTPSGYYGLIKLGENSELIINSGSSLTCYGYITGKGQVTAKDGSYVYEFMEIADWRGGTAASAWKDLGKNVFLISQYYIQNIEAHYVIEAGATSKIWAGLYAASTSYTAAVNYYGESGSLFNLTDGTLTRSYNSSTYEVDYILNGIADIQGISLKLYGIEMNSSSFIMAFHSGMSMTVKSGSKFTINSDFKLLPGSSMTIEEGATAEIASGVEVYLYDYDDWATVGFVYNDVVIRTAYWSATAGKKVQSTAVSKLDGASAQVIVDGDLIIHGNLFVTSGVSGTYYANATKPTTNPSMSDAGNTSYGAQTNYNWTSSSNNKIITGKGTITNDTAWPATNPTVHEMDQYTYYKVKFSLSSREYLWSSQQGLSVFEISTVPAVGLLAGISEGTSDVNDSFGVGVYYGLGEDHDNYWYQHVIMVDGGTAGVVADNTSPSVGETDSYMNNVRSNGTEGAATNMNVVGYACTGGSFAFSAADGYDVTYSDVALTPDDNGNYSITGIDTDIILVLRKNVVELYQATLELKSIVHLNIYFYQAGFEEIDGKNMGLLVWTGEGAYSEDEFTVDNSNVTSYDGATTNGSYFVVQTGGIAAKELGDEHYMRVYVKRDDGTYVYSKVIYYSPQTYAVNQLKNSNADENLKKLMVAMLDYAAAAQTHFGYRPDDLANAISEEYLTAYRTEFAEEMLTAVTAASETVVGNLTRDRTNCPYVVGSLILKGIITNNFSFKFTEEIMSDVQAAYLLFWDESTYEELLKNEETFAESNATTRIGMELDEKDGYYKAGYDQTAVKDLGNSIYVCGVVTTSDGTTYTSGVISYSGHTYIKNKLSSTDGGVLNLVKALGVYSDAAKTYFAERTENE